MKRRKRGSMPKPLKYIGYAIVFQEVPNETTLAFNISGCPYHCDGCHSQYLWVYEGDDLLKNMSSVIDKYRDYITCVCFMGGDQNIYELCLALVYCKRMGYKTCVYSGCNDLTKFQSIFPFLDWLKVGKYDESQKCENHTEYGVKLATANQHLYKIENGIIQ